MRASQIAILRGWSCHKNDLLRKLVLARSVRFSPERDYFTKFHFIHLLNYSIALDLDWDTNWYTKCTKDSSVKIQQNKDTTKQKYKRKKYNKVNV